MSKKPEPKKDQGPTTTAPVKDSKSNVAKAEPPKNEKVQPIKDLKAPSKSDVSKDNKIPEPKIPKDNVLVASGLLDAYEYLQKSICKHGFPQGNVFEYAAAQIMKYEKKFKAQKAAKLAERLQEVRVSMHKSKSPERGVKDHPGLHDDKKDTKKDPKKDAKKEEPPKKEETKKKEEAKKEEPKKDSKKETKKEEPKKDEPKKDAKKDEPPKKDDKAKKGK